MYNIPIEQGIGKTAFLELFKDYPNYPLRKELNIPDYYPTNPQAEILVCSKIPVQYIDKVYFEDKQTLDKYKNVVPSKVQTNINRDVFLYRRDWKFW